MELRLDGFNESLLAGHRGLGVHSQRSVSFAGWILVLAGVAASGYWGYREGHVQRIAEIASYAVSGLTGPKGTAVLTEGLPVQPITVREEAEAAARGDDPVVAGEHSEARKRVLARLDQLEAESVRGGGDRSQSLAELDRLRGEISRPVAKPAEVVQRRETGRPEQIERETPIVVARPAPAARQKPVAPVVVTESSREKPVETPRAAVVESSREKHEAEQSSLMLFRKRDAAPVIDRPAVARPIRPVQPASPEQVSAPGRTEKPEIAERMPERVPEQTGTMRAPILVVEEGGVRVVGPEGERFIPIGGKLNGKHILATSPKIGLIVTEDSAIRVNNQEKN